jgi:hypothetical protein
MGGTSDNIYRFTSDMTGKRQNVALHRNKDSIPDSVSILYFAFGGGDQSVLPILSIL